MAVGLIGRLLFNKFTLAAGAGAAVMANKDAITSEAKALATSPERRAEVGQKLQNGAKNIGAGVSALGAGMATSAGIASDIITSENPGETAKNKGTSWFKSLFNSDTANPDGSPATGTAGQKSLVEKAKDLISDHGGKLAAGGAAAAALWSFFGKDSKDDKSNKGGLFSLKGLAIFGAILGAVAYVWNQFNLSEKFGLSAKADENSPSTAQTLKQKLSFGGETVIPPSSTVDPNTSTMNQHFASAKLAQDAIKKASDSSRKTVLAQADNAAALPEHTI